jgi:hypothetical protein
VEATAVRGRGDQEGAFVLADLYEAGEKPVGLDSSCVLFIFPIDLAGELIIGPGLARRFAAAGGARQLWGAGHTAAPSDAASCSMRRAALVASWRSARHWTAASRVIFTDLPSRMTLGPMPRRHRA